VKTRRRKRSDYPDENTATQSRNVFVFFDSKNVKAYSSISELSEENCIMLKSVLSMAVFTLFVAISLSEAYYAELCPEAHRKMPISHAQRLVEDLTAPIDKRIRAMLCLSYYGAEGTRILATVLERELDNRDSITNALEGLASIEDRGVIEPILQFLENESKGTQQSRADLDSTGSMKLKPHLKERAVRILVYLAFASLEEPKSHGAMVGDSLMRMGNRLIPVTYLADGGISFVICGGEVQHYNSKGVSLRQNDVNKITKFLEKIIESEREYTTKEEKRIVQTASKGLRWIQKRIALLQEYGPKPKEPKQ
jgi:hypothetical protein